MLDFFCFPEEYLVNKDLTVSQFFENSNLNITEYQKLKNTLTSIHLLYDITDKTDNELIIVMAEFCNVISNNLSPDYIATAIARAIPQNVVVVLTLGDNAKLYVFETYQNKLNADRNVVNRTASSDWFTSSDPERYIKRAISTIQDTEFPIASVEKTMQLWMDLIHESREYKKTWHYELGRERAEADARRISLLGARELPSVEEQLQDYYNDNEIEYQKRFVGDLAKYSRIIYNEFREFCGWIILDNYDQYLYENNTEKWLCNYLDICENIVYEVLERDIFDIEIQTILKAFYSDDDVELDGDEVVDVNMVKDQMDFWELI